MPNANLSKLKLAALSFSVLMTMAVEGSMLWRMDTIAQEGAQNALRVASTARQVTLPTVIVRAPQA